jgi:cysteinyl-tRNA synthetase
MKARNEKRALLEEKATKKAANQAAEKERKRLQAEKGKTPPNEFFKVGKEGEQYGSWDENGIPLTKADGSELTKSAAKVVKKTWDQQQKRHEEYLKWLKSEEAS